MLYFLETGCISNQAFWLEFQILLFNSQAMKKAFLILTCLAAFASCKKDESKTSSNNNNNGNNNNNNNGFVPPATNYWKLNSVMNTNSADAGNSNMAGNTFSVSKPFGNTSAYSRLDLTWNSGKKVRDMVPEGEYKEFQVAVGRDVPTSSSDSVLVQITEERGGAYYYYYGTGGKIFVSKKNDKLRFSTNANLNMTGVKYPDMNTFNQTATTEFSWEEK